MFASAIHAYFTRIELDPSIGWEMLETDLDDTIIEIEDTRHLRRLLASYTARYIDMAWDDEDREPDKDSSFFTDYAVKLLRSTLPLTYDEQRQILGASVWYGLGPMFDQVRNLLKAHPVLSPSEA